MQRKLLRDEKIPQGRLQMYENINGRHERMLDVQMFNSAGIPSNILTFTTDNLSNPLSTAALMAESTIYDSLVNFYKIEMNPVQATRKPFGNSSVENAFQFIGRLNLYHLEVQGAFISRVIKFYFNGPILGDSYLGIDKNSLNVGLKHVVLEVSMYDSETTFYVEDKNVRRNDKKILLHIGRYALEHDRLFDTLKMLVTRISATPKSIYEGIIKSLNTKN